MREAKTNRTSSLTAIRAQTGVDASVSTVSRVPSQEQLPQDEDARASEARTTSTTRQETAQCPLQWWEKMEPEWFWKIEILLGW